MAHGCYYDIIKLVIYVKKEFSGEGKIQYFKVKNMSFIAKKPATLLDVANRAGVSVSTVSKVLKNSGKFKPDTVKIVEEAVKELNYNPNILARGVVTGGHSPVISFFVPNIMDPFFAEFVNYVENHLREREYLLTLCFFNDDAKLMSDHLKFLMQIRAAGVIFGPCRQDECQEDIKAAQSLMRMVSVQSDIPGITRIDVTGEQGCYDMTEYLIQNGHTKIGFLGYGYEMSVMLERLKGYKRALQENGIPVNDAYIMEGKHSYEACYACTQKLLQLQERPTAIQCATEYTARAAYKAIYDMGLSIPEDISVVGFDNISIATTLYPPLTTVSQPLDQMAAVAVDKLIELIEKNGGEELQPEHIILKHKLVIRESVKSIV